MSDHLLSDRDVVTTMPDQKSLVGDLIAEGESVVLVGEAGIGKTTLMMGMNCALATGTDWGTHKVPKKPVPSAMNAAEGTAGLKAKVQAYRYRYGFEDDETMGAYFWLRPVNFMKRDDVLWFGDHLVSREVGFMFSDPLAQCMVGGDENFAKDLGIVMDNTRVLQEATGVTHVWVHHPARGKDHARGSSVLEGAVDVLMTLKKSNGHLVLSCKKSRNRAAFKSINLRLVPTCDSAIVEPIETGTAAASERQADRDIAAVLSALLTFPDGASWTQWIDAAGYRDRNSAFDNARRALKQQGVVEKVGNVWRVIR